MNDKLIKPMAVKHIHKPRERHYFTGNLWSKYATIEEAEKAARGAPIYVGEWNNKSRMWDMTERGVSNAKQ